MIIPIVDNDFPGADSFQLCRKISTYTSNHNTVRVSFDIQSLFTKFTIEEACAMILERNCSFNQIAFSMFFSKDNFRKTLKSCSEYKGFKFNERLYIQNDGAPMSVGVSPTPVILTMRQ